MGSQPSTAAANGAAPITARPDFGARRARATPPIDTATARYPPAWCPDTVTRTSSVPHASTTQV